MNRCLINFRISKITHEIVKNDCIFSTPEYYGLLYELILSVIHPNLLMKNISFVINTNYNNSQYPIEYKLNEILLVIQILTRLILSIRIYIYFSLFYSARALRIG